MTKRMLMAMPLSHRDLLSRATIGIISVVIALIVMGAGGPPAGDGLDPSWTSVLGWAWSHGAVFGQDIVFTYGPLGFLHPAAAYMPASFHAFLVGQILVGALIGTTAGILLYRLPSIARWSYLAACLLWLPWLPTDALWLLHIGHVLVAAVLPISRDQPSSAGRTSIAAFLGASVAFFALVKLSMAWPAAVALAAAAMALFFLHRRAEALAFVAGTVTAFFGIWIGCGQPVGALASFFRGAAELSTGYSEGMAFVPAISTDILGAASMVLCGGWLAWQIWLHRAHRERIGLFFALGCIVFIIWRAGFTRADGHIHSTFPIMALCLLLGLALVERALTLSRMVALLIFAFTVGTGFYLGRDTVSTSAWTSRFTTLRATATLLANSEVRTTLDGARMQVRALHPLNAIRSRVGTQSIDVWNWEQGVLLAHDLNYHPRPVFQSYFAYTPYLTRLNETFFLGSSAPRFIMFKLQAIDGHLAMAEDPIGLLAVLRRYQPVLFEDGFLLLERSAEPTAPIPAVELTSSANLGQWIEIPEHQTPMLLSVKISYTDIGKIYKFFFRGPPMHVVVQTEDGVERIFSAGASMLRGGVLLSPLLLDNMSVMRLWTGSRPARVARIRIEPANAFLLDAFDPAIRVGFAPVSLASTALAPKVEHALVDATFPGFSLAPIEQKGTIHEVLEDGKRALFAHAPAYFRFALPAGKVNVTAEFGLVAAVEENADCRAQSDGIRMAVKAQKHGGQVRDIQLTDINPVKIAKDRGAQDLSTTAVLEDGEQLELAVEPGPPGSQISCDWAYIRNVRLTPAPLR